MMWSQERIIVSIIALSAFLVTHTSGFSVPSVKPSGVKEMLYECTQLNLHPDQGSELAEAAATELLKCQGKNDETNMPSSNKSGDNVEEDVIDDTNKHESKKLSASSSLSQPARKWWSTTFASIRGRGSSQ